MGTHPNGFKTFNLNRKDCDIWMFNEASHAKNSKGKLIYPKVDAVFQLHHEAIWKNPKNRSDATHYEWLRSGKTPTIYMQEKYPDVPKSKKYPLHKIFSLTHNVRMIINGKNKKVTYFSSSPDFALSLAAQMWKEGKKYHQIEVHGIELEMESEYQYQRTGFGFWIGYLAALGVEVKLFNSIFDSPMYGYEGDVALTSSQIEQRISDLVKELGEDKEKYNKRAKLFLDSLSNLLHKDTSAQVQKDLNNLTKESEAAGILNGRIKESSRYLEKAKTMEEASGASVFSLGEFDGYRISYNKQYIDVRGEAVNLNTQINGNLKKLLLLKKGSGKRKKALNEFGNLIANLMNKNMLMLHIVGAIRENQYYIDSIKLSFRKAGGEK